MLKAILGSLLGKFSVVALLVTGAAGGLVGTGAIPLFSTAPTFTVASGPSGSHRPAVNLDFPTSVLQPAPADAAPASPVEVVEEVVVVPAARPAASSAPVPQAVPAPRCIGDVTAALNAITAAIPSLGTGEQGQALLAQAHGVGAAANGCLAEAKQAGYAGAEGVSQLVNQVGAVIAQISALPAVAAAPAQPADPNLIGGVVGGVGSVVGGTLNLVGRGLGLLGTGLDLLTSPPQ